MKSQFNRIIFAFIAFSSLLISTANAQQRKWVVASLPQLPNQVIRPSDVKADANGNLYVADTSDNRILKRDSGGSWVVLADAGFDVGHVYAPNGIAVDGAGNLYVADTNNSRIQERHVDGTWEVLATYGDGADQVGGPFGVAIDGSGNLFVTDSWQSLIRERHANGDWEIIYGSNPGEINSPWGIAADGDGDLFVSDTGENRLKERLPNGTWQVISVSNSNIGTSPYGLSVDRAGNLYVADAWNYHIQIRDKQGIWTTISSSGSDLGQVNGPFGVGTDANGNLFVADTFNNRIQMRSAQGDWSILAEIGTAPGQMNQPVSAVKDAKSGDLYVSDAGNNRIQKRDSAGNWSILAPQGSDPGFVNQPVELVLDKDGDLLVADAGNSRIQAYDLINMTWTVFAPSGVNLGEVQEPIGLARNLNGDIYVSDYGNNRIQKRDVTNGTWSSLTDPGRITSPGGLAVDLEDDVFVVDNGDGSVKERLSNGSWLTIATGGSDLGFVSSPKGLWIDGDDNLYVADKYNNRIQTRTSAGVWSIFAPMGFDAGSVLNPEGVSEDDAKNFYVADTNNNRIEEYASDITPPVSTVSLSPSAPDGSNGWYKSDVTATLSATDDSGVFTLYYSLDGATLQETKTVPIDVKVTTDGSHSLSFYAIDSSVNAEKPPHEIKMKIDKTPPTITASAMAGENPYSSGTWTNQNVIVTISCQDSGSGVDTVTSPQTVSKEGANQSVAGTCVDKAGNSASVSFGGIKIDKTAPAISFGTATPAPNANGWRKTNVSIPFSATDSGSGVASSAPAASPLILVAEGSAVAGSVTATDAAGNSASLVSPAVKIDKTPPTITASATAGGSPYASGAWTNQSVVVTFACQDGGSGVDTVTAPQTVSTEGASQSVTGSCVDKAGNSASVAFGGIDIDKTPPIVSATATAFSGSSYGAGQWETRSVTVAFSCSDAGSGVGSVSGPMTISTEGMNQSATGTCVDNAGNVSTTTFGGIDIDRTPPTVTTSATSGGKPYAPGAWTNQDVTVTFACQDGGSGVASVTSPQTISSDGSDQSVSGICVDKAGNEATASFDGINIDKTPPTIAASATSGGSAYAPGAWTNQIVTVAFACQDGGSGVASTTSPLTVSTEGANQSATGTCVDKAGNSASASFGGIDLDRTPPVTVADLSQSADGTPQVALTATDGLSGVGGIRYALDGGSDTAYVGALTIGEAGIHSLAYEATDTAGNVEEAESLTFSRLELVAPIQDATATNPPTLAWKALPGATGYEIEWSRDPSFPAGGTDAATTTETTLALTEALASGQWHWRAKGDVPGATGLYATGTFEIEATVTPPAILPGDADGNGKLDIGDATLALRIAVGLLTGTPAQIAAADYNQDGKVSIQDATLILRKAIGL